MKVNIEDIEEAQKVRRKINQANIYNIQFYKNGIKLDIANIILDDFRFGRTGKY